MKNHHSNFGIPEVFMPEGIGCIDTAVRVQGKHLSQKIQAAFRHLGE